MAQFTVKPHDAPRKKRTKKQDAATMRAFLIFRLRGLYMQADLLTGTRRLGMKAMVNEELIRLGAAPQWLHEERQAAAIEAKQIAAAEEEGIPL
jgi:hypothetical protein